MGCSHDSFFCYTCYWRIVLKLNKETRGISNSRRPGFGNPWLIQTAIVINSELTKAYCFTGIIFGFPNLRSILEKEGIWNGTCSDGSDCTEEHKSNYGLVALLAILSGNVMSLPLGLLLDKYGAFWCRFACALFITLGLVHFWHAILYGLKSQKIILRI